MDGGKSKRGIFLGWLLWTSLMIFENNAQISLKERLCNQTGDNFIACMNCLNRPGVLDEGRNHQEEEEREDVKIGAKTIRCAISTTLSVRDIMIEYSKNSTSPIQGGATYCAAALTEAAKAFNTALTYWSYKKKDYTISAINDGNKVYQKCARQFPPEKPPVLNDGLDTIRARGEVACSVISVIQV